MYLYLSIVTYYYIDSTRIVNRDTRYISYQRDIEDLEII